MVKSKLVLLDANVIIKLHELNLWEHIVQCYEVHVPSVVLHDEAFYFDTAYGHEPITLQPFIAAGRIFEIEASADEMRELSQHAFKLVQTIDPGETEALALLQSERGKNFRFCTGDGQAILAMAVLGLATDQGVSMEALIRDTGRQVRDIPPSFSENAFKRRVAEGFMQKDLYR